MDFRFGIYTEVTDLVFEMYPEYKYDGYERFFICPDTHDFWVIRILKGYGEDYEVKEGSFLLERNKIDRHQFAGRNVTVLQVRKVITLDREDGGNWDYVSSDDIDNLINEYVDSGYGVLNIK